MGCFRFSGLSRQYFSLYRAISQREGERGERVEETKTVQTPPKLPVLGRPTIWIIVGHGPAGLAVGAWWGLFGHFFLNSILSLFLLLWETARYRLKYRVKGPLNSKQPTILFILAVKAGWTAYHSPVDSEKY